MSGVVVGEGFRFGYKAAGDTAALLSLGQQYDLDVSVVNLVAASGEDKARCISRVHSDTCWVNGNDLGQHMPCRCPRQLCALRWRLGR